MSHIELIDVGSPVDLAELLQIEEMLAAKLPADYRNFIELFSGGCKVHAVCYPVENGASYSLDTFNPIGANVQLVPEYNDLPPEYHPMLPVASGIRWQFYLSLSEYHFGQVVVYCPSEPEFACAIETFNKFLNGLTYFDQIEFWKSCKYEPWKSIQMNDWGAFQKALDNDFDLSSKEPDIGHPVLTIAAANKRARISEKLISIGADPNQKGKSGMSAVHIGAYVGGCADVLEILLQHGADIHATDDNGNTPLHLVVKYRASFDAFSWLVEHGADAYNKRNAKSESVFDMLERRKSRAPDSSWHWKPHLEKLASATTE